jgi:hypothetical protein
MVASLIWPPNGCQESGEQFTERWIRAIRAIPSAHDQWFRRGDEGKQSTLVELGSAPAFHEAKEWTKYLGALFGRSTHQVYADTCDQA